MRINRFVILGITAILLSFNLVLGFEAEDKDSEHNNKQELKSIVQRAELQKQLFKLRLILFDEINFAEKQILNLRSNRLKIEKEVKRLEILSNKYKKQKGRLKTNLVTNQAEGRSREEMKK
ncbi:MAG: hypothetical protein ACE5JB_10290 [bacterium]